MKALLTLAMFCVSFILAMDANHTYNQPGEFWNPVLEMSGSAAWFGVAMARLLKAVKHNG